jgi:hypothetical protein
VVKLVLLDEAQTEVVEAISHYENIESGLGRKLRDEIISHLAWIQANPQVLRLRPPGYYRVNLRTFPYYIPYIKREETLWILALAHVRRKPLYWIKRKFTP